MMEQPFLTFTIGDVATLITVIIAAYKVVSEIASIRVKLEILWRQYEADHG